MQKREPCVWHVSNQKGQTNHKRNTKEWLIAWKVLFIHALSHESTIKHDEIIKSVVAQCSMKVLLLNVQWKYFCSLVCSFFFALNIYALWSVLLKLSQGWQKSALNDVNEDK